jgi:hypothetical protein
MRFTLGPPVPAAPPSPADAASAATFSGSPAGAYPGAPPGRPPGAPGPTGPAFGEMTPETAKPDGQEGLRLPVRESKLQTVLLVGVGMFALCAAGVAVWWKLTHNDDSSAGGGGGITDTDKNISWRAPPKPPWNRDDEMRAKLDAPYFAVYRRDNPEAYVAIGARDFDTREPRPSELRAGLLAALDKLLERDTRKEYAPEFDTTWMGQQGQAFKFTGGLKGGGGVEGEAVAVSFRGVAYWFVSWTGQGLYDEQKAAFADARSRCKILELRDDWKPKQSTVVSFRNNVLGYALLDGDGIWTEVTDEKRVRDEDPKADKLLLAKVKQKGRDFDEEADLVVYVLDAGGDPLAAARAYVERQANANPELRGVNIFTDDVGPPEGDPTPNVVDGNAPYVLLKSRNDRDAGHTWLYAISAIKVGDKTVAACAKCKWSQRAVFDTRFIQIVKSLRAER